MSDIFNKVVSQQDAIRKLLGKIPGFSGYFERENRRSSDKVLRDMVAKQFEEVWSRISGLQRDLISQGAIYAIDDLEAAAVKIRQVIDRVQKASYGYSGFFDAVKINEKELELLYNYDLAMLDNVDAVSKAVDNVETSIGSDGLPAAIRNLTMVAEQCVSMFNKRAEVITASIPQ
ncbi:MAG: hypothetical protein C0391_01200 [Anaerolinea sp.]|nr:hypothetical protein [Anaerolinea sp.]